MKINAGVGKRTTFLLEFWEWDIYQDFYEDLLSRLIFVGFEGEFKKYAINHWEGKRFFAPGDIFNLFVVPVSFCGTTDEFFEFFKLCDNNLGVNPLTPLPNPMRIHLNSNLQNFKEIVLMGDFVGRNLITGLNYEFDKTKSLGRGSVSSNTQ